MQITDDMVERAARSIKEEIERFRDPAHLYIEDEARARYQAAHPGDDYYINFDYDDLESYRIIARAALSAEQTQPVAVKALEWHSRLQTGEREGFICSSSGILSYSIMLSRFRVYGIDSPHDGAMEYSSLDEAKAAAQSDYETRIRAALVDVPAEPVAWQSRTRIKEPTAEWSPWRDGRQVFSQKYLELIEYEERPLYTSPYLSREGEDTAEVEQTVGSHEITDFLYKHGDLTYSAAARAVQLLTGNGYGFTASSEARKESLLTMRKALNKIADMIDAEDADLDDAISIATTALAATRSGSATEATGGDHG